MQFRKAYLDSIDAQLQELEKQINQIAVIASSFHHLSAAGLEEELTEAGQTAAVSLSRVQNGTERRTRVRPLGAGSWPTEDSKKPRLVPGAVPHLPITPVNAR